MSGRGDWRLAWWQLRGQRLRVWLLVACVAVGVAARVCVGAFTAQMEQATAREARILLGADVEVSGRRPLPTDKRAQLDALLPAGAETLDTIDFTSMAAADGRARVVVVRGIEPGWPFYGEVVVRAGDGLDGGLESLFADEPRVFVQRDLLLHLDLAVGDRLKLGTTRFRIVGVIEDLPGLGVEAFAIGPLVLTDRRQLTAAGLTGFGLLADHQILVRLPDPAAAEGLADALLAAWDLPPDARERRRGGEGRRGGLRVRTPDDLEDRFRRAFEHFARFLRLMALFALIVGGIGVAGVTRAFITANIEAVATLRVLGAAEWRLVRVFLLQVLLPVVPGSLLGAALGVVAQLALAGLMADFVPMELRFALAPDAIAWGVLLGLATATVFALVSLLTVVRVQPMAVFRGAVRPAQWHPAWWWAVLAGVAIFLLLGVHDAGTWSMALLVLGVVVASLVLLAGLGLLLVPLFARVGRVLPFGARHGLANLRRMPLKVLPSLMAVGLLALVVAALLIYQRSLLREFATDQARPPDLFAFNITDQDRQGMQDWLAARDVAADFAPLVFARLRTIDGESIAEDADSLDAEDDRDRHFRRREQRLSWRRELATSERIIAGEWMDVDASPDAPIEASVEEEYAEALGVDLGDTLGFEIMGVPLTVTVTSLREVRWASMQPNFFILVTPSALAGAPGTWVASFYCPDPAVRDAIQVGLVERFPQITILDVEQVLGKVRGVLDKVSWAVSFMAVFVLVAGLVVLAAVGLVSARERLRDAALLRVLGGTGRTLAASLTAEFGVIGLASALAGSALAVIVTASLLHLIDLRFTPPWSALLVLIVAITAISVATGLIACRRVFRVRPLVVLRDE